MQTAPAAPRAPATGSAIAAIVRRHDPDRYFTALFAPAPWRETLLTLYAFNHELARAREVTSNPTLALIRLYWWREVVMGEHRPHEVATPLHAALAAGWLHAPDLLAMIDARELETEMEIATPAWRAWLLQGAGSLAVAAARLLGAPDDALDRQRARGAGTAIGGLLRSIPAFARQGRCLLPADLLAHHNLTPDLVIAAPHSPALAPIRAALAAEGTALLGDPSPCGRGWIAAALPAVLARRDLRRLSARPRLVDDRIAVIAAAVRGKA
jgi:phytoene synthase